MKLKSGRSVIEIQKDGYKEVQPTEGNPLLTPAEWDEFCARTAKENNLRIVSESRKRVDANRAAFEADKAKRNENPAVRCDQCAACMIQGVFCHETGCPNSSSRYEDGEWIKQRKCFECGCTVDADDLCCNAEVEQDSAWQHAPEKTCDDCDQLLEDCECGLDEDEEDTFEHEDTDSLEDRGITLGSYGS